MSRRKHTPIYVAGGCFFVLLMALSLLVRKGDHAPAPRTLADIRQQGTLRALTDGSSTGAARDSDGLWRGFQYEILKRFADSLGMQLAVTPVDDLSRCIGELATGHYDLVAAAMPPHRPMGLRVGLHPPADAVAPDARAAGRHAYRARHHHAATPTGGRHGVHPQRLAAPHVPATPVGRDCRHHIYNRYSVHEPGKAGRGVAAGRVKHTIVHEQLARKLVREHRNLDASLPVSLEQPGCWAVNKQSADLLAELNNFLDRFVGSLEYWRLYREYY